MAMKLYGSLTSPYVRKCRILIAEKGLSCDFEVQAPGPGSLVRQLNPLGKVPTLQLPDGTVLFDSPVILEYLDSLDEPALVPPGGPLRWEVLRWQALADGLMDATVARLMELRRSEAHRSLTVVTREEERIEACLEHFAQQLAGRTVAVDTGGGALTLADIAIVSALGYLDLRFPEANWRERHTALGEYAAPLFRRPSIESTRPPG